MDELFTLLPQHSENGLLESLGLTVESSVERKYKSHAEAESAKGGQQSQYVPHKKQELFSQESCIQWQ